MKLPRILTLVLAGGQGKRLGSLTQERAKPAVPFAGHYRLIDFALSNCRHSQLRDVWVVEQFESHSLNEHLKNGRPWDLDQTIGGMQIVSPMQRKGDKYGWHQGNADALWRNARLIRAFNPEIVLVLSADAIYRFDYRDLIEAHLQNKAEVTMVTTKVKKAEATRFGNVQINAKSQVAQFEYKPEEPISRDVTAEIFAYDVRVLLEVLDELIKRTGQSEDEAALSDFGDELLPELVARGKAFAFPFDGYWRDVGTVESYFEAHQDFLSDTPPFRLDDEAWPILSRFAPVAPAWIAPEAKTNNAQISGGCTIWGRVENSVIGPQVTIDAGAVVVDSIVLGGARIRKGVRVERAIIDEGVEVKKDVLGKDEIAVV